MNQNILLKLLILFFLVAFILLAFPFIHELGHALVALAAGGEIVAFSIRFPTAHVAYHAPMTSTLSALSAVSGVGLTYLAWLALILFTRKGDSPVLPLFKFIATLSVMGSLLVWIIFPVLYLAGRAPSDDVTGFLSLTGVPPLLVTALALLAFAGGIWLYRQLPQPPAELAHRVGGPLAGRADRRGSGDPGCGLCAERFQAGRDHSRPRPVGARGRIPLY
jgi:hypothetical protein